MRLVQLDLGGYRLEFHPYVTVLRGLHDSLRAELVATLEALAVGEAISEGMVEAHGVFLDLDDDVLTLLDLGKPGRAGLDLVVHADQVTAGLAPAALARNDLDHRREQIAGEVARLEAESERAQLALVTSREQGTGSVERVSAELERQVGQRQALEASLASAELSHAGAREALDAARARLADAHETRAAASAVAEEASEALEQARAGSDPFAAAAFDAARDRLQALQQPDGSDGGSTDDASVDVDELELRRSELEVSLLALDSVDPAPVESALDHLTSDDDVELVPSPDATRLADEWVGNEAALGGESSVEEASGNVLAAARHRLDVARAAVFEAERAARVPDIDRLDIEALENAHEAVLVAQERTQKRVGQKRATQKLTEARAMEQAILDRMGFDTYASFVMGTSIQHVDTEREEGLEASRVELSAAEDALAVLEQGVDAELAVASLLARRRDLRDEATVILGRDPGDDIEWALRNHRIEVSDSGDRARRLHAALESAGMVLGAERPPRDMLVELAQVWLDEQRQTEHRRNELTEALGEVQAALGRAPKSSSADTSDNVDQAQAAMATAELRLQRQSGVEAEVAARKADLADALAAERAAVAELAAAEAAEVDAARVEHESAAERSRLEAEVATATADEQQTSEALGDLTHLVEDIATEDRPARAAAVSEAEAAVALAARAVTKARDELAEVDGLLERTASGNGDAPAATTVAAVQDLEWFLLSRLANQRSLSYAGSLPFVLDDALRGVRDKGLDHLLGRLERISSAVQVVILSDDGEISAWAESIGPDRAIALHPVPL